MTDVQWISILFFFLCYFNYSYAEPAKRCDSYEGSEFAKAPDFLEEPAEEMMSDAESGGTETICDKVELSYELNSVIINKILMILELDAIERKRMERLNEQLVNAKNPCNKNSIDKASQMLLEIKSRQPIEIANALTPSQKIDIGKLDWQEAKFDKNVNDLDFSKLTAEDLKKILDETMNHANCPLGSFYDSSKGCISFENFGIVPQTSNFVDIDAIFNKPLPSVASGEIIKRPVESGEEGQIMLHIDPSKLVQISTDKIESEAPVVDANNLRENLPPGNPEQASVDIKGNVVDEAETPELLNSVDIERLQPSTDSFPNMKMNISSPEVTGAVNSALGMDLSSPEVTGAVHSAVGMEGLNEWLKNLQLEVDAIGKNLVMNMSNPNLAAEPVMIQPTIIKETVPTQVLLNLSGKMVQTPGEMIQGKLPVKLTMETSEEKESAGELIESLDNNQARKSSIDVNKLKVNMKGKAGSIVSNADPLGFKPSFSGSLITPKLSNVGLHLEGDASSKTSAITKPFQFQIPIKWLQSSLQNSINLPTQGKMTLNLNGDKSPEASQAIKTVKVQLPMDQLKKRLLSMPGLNLSEGSMSSTSKVVEKQPAESLENSFTGSFIAPKLNNVEANQKEEASQSSRKSTGNSPNVDKLSGNIEFKTNLNLMDPSKFISAAVETHGVPLKEQAPKTSRGKKQAFFVHQLPLKSRKSAYDEGASTEGPKAETQTKAAAAESATTEKSSVPLGFIPKIQQAGKEILKANNKVVSIFLPGLFKGRRNGKSFRVNNEIVKNVPEPEIAFQSVEGKTMSDEDETTPKPATTSTASYTTTIESTSEAVHEAVHDDPLEKDDAIDDLPNDLRDTTTSKS